MIRIKIFLLVIKPLDKLDWKVLRSKYITITSLQVDYFLKVLLTIHFLDSWLCFLSCFFIDQNQINDKDKTAKLLDQVDFSKGDTSQGAFCKVVVFPANLS